MYLLDYLRIHNITYITYLDLQNIKIWSLNTLVNISSVWQLIFATSRKESTGSEVGASQETATTYTKTPLAFLLF